MVHSWLPKAGSSVNFHQQSPLLASGQCVRGPEIALLRTHCSEKLVILFGKEKGKRKEAEMMVCYMPGSPCNLTKLIFV